MADGYLTFDTKMNTAGFKAGISSMTGMFAKLAAVMGVALSVNALVQFGKAGVQAASEMGAKFKGLEFLMRANNRSMQQATVFIQEFTADGLVPMTSAYEAYKNMVSRGYDTSQIEQMMTVMKDAAVYNRQGQFSMGEAIEKATMGLRMENSLLTDSVGIQKNVAKMWAEYAKEIGTTANNLTMAQKRQAEFNGFMKEGGVFAGAAGEYTDSYAGKVSALSASFLNLKIAVGNALIPIINALLPAINAAVLGFTKFFNIVGRVMNLLFGSNVSAADLADNTQAGADAAGEMAENTEAAGKAAEDALASFDKLNVLAQAEVKATGGDEAAVEVPPPDTEPFTDEIDALAVKVEEFKTKLTALFQPAIDSFNNLMLALEPAKTFVATGLNDFYNNFLLPLATWVIGTALPDFLNSTANAIALINWPLLNESLNGLWLALEPFAVTVGLGLLNFYRDVLLPIGLWVSNDLAPAFLDLLAAAINALDELLVGASPAIDNFWNDVMMPILSFAGTLVIGLIGDLTWALERFGEWCKNNAETVKYATSIVLIFLAELWTYATVKKVAAWITSSLIPNIAKFAAALVGMNVPLVLGALGVAFLLGGIIAISKVWDKLTPQERTITILRSLAAALLAAAIAVAVFHTSWSVGLGAAAIVAGLALLASASYFSGIKLPNLLSGGTVGSLKSLPNFSLPGLATGAVIPPNAPFAAVLGDQRSGKNIEAPLKTIEQAVDNALARRGAGAGGTISFDVDEAGLMRYLHPKFTAETWRTGDSLARKAGAA